MPLWARRVWGDRVGANPTDRAKNGSKHSLLVEGDGGPLAALTELTQHLCLDKGYSGAPSDATARVFGYVPHVRQIGQEKLDNEGRKRYPARRWVVERTLAWLSKCRAILIRYNKKSCNYL